MTITTEEAERFVELGKVVPDGSRRVAAAISTLAAERDALRAKVERQESGVSYETFVSAMRIVTTERDALKAENARLREAMEMARDCLEDKDVIGAKQTLTLALGEKE
jgi:hypothetical protein